ncbi:MAG TPA: 6-hydroxynicotinate reductase, partial [Firmicutes bacterium]|nr:6-hydroxynicotinate reductase [Bacillota bacterium]
MLIVDQVKCTGCGSCAKDCPVAAIAVCEKKAIVAEHCVYCGVCLRVCRAGALALYQVPPETALTCTSCPVRCTIKPGFFGACRRYLNHEGV